MTRSLRPLPLGARRLGTALGGLALALLVLAAPGRAQTLVADAGAPRRVGAAPAPAAPRAVRATGALRLDGRLDEAAWASAETIEGFTQREPNEGAPATQRTVVRLVYDDAAFYVGARLYDTAPDSIRAPLARRDGDVVSDLFMVFLDPYHDRHTGYYFGVSAGGTQYDGTLFNDSWDSSDWDGVWTAKTTRDAEGWTAEIRIPYSQLRFRKADVQTWGVNFRRDVARRQERAYFVHVPQGESGFVSRFHELGGIDRIRPGLGLELTPYVTAQAAFRDAPGGDPFRSDAEGRFRAGGDLRARLGSGLTLSAAVNPDFGQVEVDPAVVNLSDREVFFSEKRPFFVEGQDVFNFGYGGANNNSGFNWGNPEFFYTRRVGRSAQGFAPGGYAHYDRPEGTTILGAAKVTGRVGETSVGLVQSVTARGVTVAQHADGGRDRFEVEPLTSYSVGRAQRQFRGGRVGLGALGTVTARAFRDDALRDQINGNAYTGGVDGWVHLGRKASWALTGWAGASHVTGTPAQIARLQRSSLHYLQRPDLGAADLDPTRTALTGFSGRAALNKQDGNFIFNAAAGAIDPYFDVNDLGFQFNGGGYANAHVMTGYAWRQPNGWARYRQVLGAVARSWDWDGTPIASFVWTNNRWQLPNYWTLQGGGVLSQDVQNPRRTRGGPLSLQPRGASVNASVSSDPRKDVRGSAYGFAESSRAGSSWNGGAEVTWQPAPRLNLSVGPDLSRNRTRAQYVATVADPLATATYGARYVFADLDQWTLSASVRANVTFTPRMSLQLYAQPLVASGAYAGYKELARPRTFSFTRYGEGAGTITPTQDEQGRPAGYAVDPDGAGAAPAFTLGRPDFAFASLRGNAVYRWEYRPGSTLYLVWTQLLEDGGPDGTDGAFAPWRSTRRLFDAKPENVFMLKLTYWLGR